MNQTELSNFLDEVLDELQYRIEEGLINLNNPTHKSILSEILHEQNMGHLLNPIVDATLLTEADPKTKDKPSNPSDEDYSHLGNGIYVKKGNEEKPTAPKFKKDEQGNYKAMSAAEAGDIKQKAGEDGGSKNNPQAKTDDGSKPADAQGAGSNGGEQAEAPPVNIFDDPEYQNRISANEKAAKGEDDEDIPADGLYSVGGGYYSTKKDGPAEFIRTEQMLRFVREAAGEMMAKTVGGKDIKVKKIVQTNGADALRSLSKLKKNTVNGDENNSETIVKNQMLKYGYAGFEEVTGTKPAPGGAGSAFNEIVSCEGVHILNENPSLTEEQLAEIMYQNFGDSKLGDEQKLTTGVNIPEHMKLARKNAVGTGTVAKPQYPEQLAKADREINKYSKCVVAARSSRTKYDRTEQRTKTLQESGKLGDNTKIHTFYGADVSLAEQVNLISKSNNVLLPDGTKLTKDDAIAFIKMGGGGANPSDTATFVSDENGNVMVQFHSDKTTTEDIQDNSTISTESINYSKSVESSSLSTDEKEAANKIINEITDEIDKIESKYIDQSAPIAINLSKLPFDKQMEIINNDTGTLIKNINAALTGTTGKGAGKELSSKYKKFNRTGKDFQDMSIDEKYQLVRDFVASGNGAGADVKVTNKLALQYQAENKEVLGLNVKKLISEQREHVVRLQRERVERLNNFKITVGNMSIPLGTSCEADEAIRGFHFSLMDFPPRDYVQGDISSIAGKALDINMGGTIVDGTVLRHCLGVNSTEEFKQKFSLAKNDDLTYASSKKEIVTGKNVFSYYVDKHGNKKEIGKKTYRSKTGATGKTSNTMQYSKEIQNCFKSKQGN